MQEVFTAQKLYINDFVSSTVQQIFVRSCKPYTPANPVKPSTTTEHVDYHVCEDCGDKFLFASSLSFHINRYSVAIQYKCNECSSSLTFYNRCNFLAHLRQHNLELSEEELGLLDITSHPIPKHEIPPSFNHIDVSNILSYSELGISKESDTVLTTSICVECNESVTTTLALHYQGNGSVYSHSLLHCTECLVSLPTSCALKAHARTHTLESPFICPDCCYEYTTWDSLSRHLEYDCLHAYKVMRYKCPICQSMHVDTDKLCKHLGVQHVLLKTNLSNQLPNCWDQLPENVCQVCHEVVSKNNVLRHMRHHSNESSARYFFYRCPSCEFCCQKKTYFNHHRDNCPGEILKRQLVARNVISRNIAAEGIEQGLVAAKSKSDLRVQRLDDSDSNVESSSQRAPSVDSASNRNGLSNRYQDSPVLDEVEMPLTPSPEPSLKDDLADDVLELNNSEKNYVDKTKEQNDPLAVDVQENMISKLTNVEPNDPISCSQKSRKINLMKLKMPKIVNDLIIQKHQCTKCKAFIKVDGTYEPIMRHFASLHPECRVTVSKRNELVVSPVKRGKFPVTHASRKLSAKLPKTDNVQPIIANSQFKAVSCNITDTADDEYQTKVSEKTHVSKINTDSTNKNKGAGRISSISVPRTSSSTIISPVTKKSKIVIMEKKQEQIERIVEVRVSANSGSVNKNSPKKRKYKRKKSATATDLDSEQPESLSVKKTQVIVMERVSSSPNDDVVVDLEDNSVQLRAKRAGRKASLDPDFVSESELTPFENPEEPSSSDESFMPDLRMKDKKRKRNNDPDFVCNHPAYRAIVKKAKKNNLKGSGQVSDNLSNKRLTVKQRKQNIQPQYQGGFSAVTGSVKAQEIPFTDPELPKSNVRIERRGRKKVIDPGFNASGKPKTNRIGRPPKRKNMVRSPTHLNDLDLKSDLTALGCGVVMTRTKINADKAYICSTPFCTFSSTDKELFTEHIVKHRTDENALQCMECGLFFVVKPTFTKHLFINHNIYDVETYIKDNDCCDKEILNKKIDEATEESKVLAENVPTVLLENQCNICYKVCDDSMNLNIHFRTHGLAFLRMNRFETKPTLPVNANETTVVSRVD